MKWMRRLIRQAYGSNASAWVLLWALRHGIYCLRGGLFASASHFALLHPRPCYPVHGLIVPRLRVRALYELTGVELESAVRDGLRAARLLPWREEDRHALLLINGGCFQTFSQAHFHLFARQMPPYAEAVPVRSTAGFTLFECMHAGATEPDLLVFKAASNLFSRFMAVFYPEIMPAYGLMNRGYAVYVSIPLPAPEIEAIGTIYIRLQPRSDTAGKEHCHGTQRTA